MMKLTDIFEGFLHPGEHDNDGSKHRFSRQPRPKTGASGNTFPYTEPAGETLTDEEIEEELGLKEFKTGPTMSAKDNLRGKGKMPSGQGMGGGKSSKTFGNYMDRANTEDPADHDETHAVSIEWMNYDPEEEFESFDKYFGLEEGLGIRARPKATKELGQVSTKQPWANGIPGGGPDEYMITGDDDEISKEELEDDVGLSLESICKKIVKEWADDDWSRGAQTAKAGKKDEDLNFFDDNNGSNQYLMNTEDEFNKNQKRRKRKRGLNVKKKV